jgi:hypothetical protein
MCRRASRVVAGRGGGRELAALAEEDDVVDAVPGFDEVQALIDLALQVAVAQVGMPVRIVSPAAIS